MRISQTFASFVCLSPLSRAQTATANASSAAGSAPASNALVSVSGSSTYMPAFASATSSLNASNLTLPMPSQAPSSAANLSLSNVTYFNGSNGTAPFMGSAPQRLSPEMMVLGCVIGAAVGAAALL